MALNDKEKRELEEEMSHYETKQAACLEGLKILQRHRGGWVSDESIQDLAEFLEMSPEEVDNAATFYNLIFRKPVGKHVILLCDSISCWVMGYPQIREALEQRLGIGFGKTTPDGAFTLLPMACLGTCDHAPAMMVGEALFRDLNAHEVNRIIDHFLEMESTMQEKG